MRAAKAKKLYHGRCLFCGDGGAGLLDNHRGLVPGSAGGTYTWANTIPACPSCHRKCHLGLIKVLGRFLGSSGTYYYRCEVDGEERFLADAPPPPNE